jgi:hypothetical protein
MARRAITLGTCAASGIALVVGLAGLAALLR